MDSRLSCYCHLKLLPVSLYPDLHDVLSLLQKFYGIYFINFAGFLTMKPKGRLTAYKMFDLPSHHYKRSQENFWYRSAKLVKIINPFVEVLNQKGFMTAKKTSVFSTGSSLTNSTTLPTRALGSYAVDARLAMNVHF